MSEPRDLRRNRSCIICKTPELAEPLRELFEKLVGDREARRRVSFYKIADGFLGGEISYQTVRRHRNWCLRHLGPW